MSSIQTNEIRLLHWATYAAVGTAATLIIIKLGAWIVTGSVSILASLVDSLLDIGASGINLIAVRYSLRPPDSDHRFGHGKAESLAGLAQATFITGSAVFLILEALDRLRQPRAIEQVELGLLIIAISIVATAILLAFQYYVIKRTQSQAIKADALHYATDLGTGSATLLALVLADTLHWYAADAWFAIGIALLILYGAWKIGYSAMQSLMDRELPDDQRSKIMDIVLSHSEVIGVHDLRTRQSGRTQWIQLHLDLNGELSLFKAHAIADEVEKLILNAFPNAEVLIHQDPVEPETVQLIKHSHR